MGRIEDGSSTRRTNAVNQQQQTPQPAPRPTPTPQRANRVNTRRVEVGEYGATRRAQIEAQLDERERETPAGNLVAGALRGGRAARTEITERALRDTGRVYVDGSPAFRAQVERDLNRIAPGTTVGTDGLVRRTTSEVPGHEQGYRLVNHLLNNPNPVTIQYAPNDAAAGMTSTDANGSIGRPGTGSGANVYYDPAGQFSLPTFDATGRVTNQPADSAVVLAHELAHASHFQRGTRDPRSGTTASTPPSPTATRTLHYVNDGGTIFREPQNANVRMREEFRTTGFSGYRQRNEPSELSIRSELGLNNRASYMPQYSYEPASRLEAVFGNATLHARNTATTVVDGVRGSRNSAAIGGTTAFVSTAYEQWRTGDFDAGQLAGQTTLGLGTGVTEEVIERVVTGAPSVTTGATASTFRLAASQLRGAGVAGAVTGSAFAVYDNYSAYRNNEITGAQFAGRVAGEAVTGAAAGMAGAYAGAVIGSFIPIPVVGTLAGAAVGFAVGYLADRAIRGLGVDRMIASGVESAVNFGQNVVSNVSQAASNVVEGTRDAIGNLASGAVNTLSSIFG